MAESLNNIGGMANTNQQTGQGNALLGLIMGRQFNKKKKGSGQNKAHFENLAELERHKSQLRMDEKAHEANIRDTELTRSYDLGDGEGHIHHRGRAFRKITEYEGGEVPLEDKRLGMRTGGYRKPAEASEDNPSKGQQMRAVPVTEGSNIPFTKKSVQANDKRAEQARIDASYGIGEKSMTDIAHEAGARGRLEAAADVVMPKRGRETSE